jgi:methyl-accepting chemotaxis protein
LHHGLLGQISKAILQMEQVTQTVAANAEEGSAAAEELKGQANAVRDIVAELHAMVVTR